MADVLKQTIGVSVTLERNSRTMYAQRFMEEDQAFSESTHQRVVLATNMTVPQEVDLSGVTDTPSVTRGSTLFVETDRPVLVAVNSVSNLWPLAANGALLLTGTISHVYVQNESTIYEPVLEIVCTG